MTVILNHTHNLTKVRANTDRQIFKRAHPHTDRQKQTDTQTDKLYTPYLRLPERFALFLGLGVGGVFL